jgi:hypothetical protein
MRYQIRTGEGRELEVRDGAHLILLLRQKFLEGEDEIRRKGQERWRKLRDIPEYADLLKEDKLDVRRFQMIFFVTALLGCIAIICAILYRLGPAI